MSDKLKIAQSSISGNQEEVDLHLYCASIGYPELKTTHNGTGLISALDCEQPELDESAFRDYATKEDYLAHTSLFKH